MKLSVDLNADLGEGSGHDSELFELISSANIATGFHAGDPKSILDSFLSTHIRVLRIARTLGAKK